MRPRPPPFHILKGYPLTAAFVLLTDMVRTDQRPTLAATHGEDTPNAPEDGTYTERMTCGKYASWRKGERVNTRLVLWLEGGGGYD